MRCRGSARRVGAGAALAAAFLAAGCGASASHLTAPSLPGASRPTTGSAPGTSGPTASQTPSTSATTAPPAHHVGDAVPLTGAGGLAAIVQVVGVVDPATPAAAYDQPGAGLRYVAARIALHNVGPAPLTTNLLSDASVDDGTGSPVSPIVLDMANCPVDFGGELALAPGGPVSVECVAFEVPAAAPVKAVQVRIAPPPAGQATWSNP